MEGLFLFDGGFIQEFNRAYIINFRVGDIGLSLKCGVSVYVRFSKPVGGVFNKRNVGDRDNEIKSGYK
jgi:hypothetical protein